MTEITQRQDPRFPARLPVLYVLSEDQVVQGSTTLGFTHNLSKAGLTLHVRKPLAPGSTIDLLVFLGDRIVEVQAMVTLKGEGSSGQMDLTITGIKESDSHAWEQFLSLQAWPNSRTFVRTPVALDTICRTSSAHRIPGHIQNLSQTGLMISVSELLPLKSRLKVEVPARQHLPPVEIEGEIIWNYADSHQHLMTHGLGFVSPDVEIGHFVTGVLLRQLFALDETSPKRGLYLMAVLGSVSPIDEIVSVS